MESSHVAKQRSYEEMRGLELEMNEFIDTKLTSIKEDMLVSGGAQAHQDRLMQV